MRQVKRSENGLWLVWQQVPASGRPRADGTQNVKWVIEKVFASRARVGRYVGGVES